MPLATPLMPRDYCYAATFRHYADTLICAAADAAADVFTPYFMLMPCHCHAARYAIAAMP